MQRSKLVETLRILQKGGVEFVVVGGLAAVLNGAPIQTYDIDLVYSRDQANLDYLLAALDCMDAIFRIQPERRLRPAAGHLQSEGHLNLLTRYGPLDLLGAIGNNLGYHDLVSRSIELQIDAMLPILRRTLQEIRRKRDAG